MAGPRQIAATYSIGLCFCDASSSAARASATFRPLAFRRLAIIAPFFGPRTFLPLSKYSRSGMAGSGGAALAVASISVCSIFPISSFSRQAACSGFASGSLASKKPFSTKGLRTSASSPRVMWRRNASLSRDAVILPSSYSLASSHNIGASALLATGKQENS
jgi:hypothetical protein